MAINDGALALALGARSANVILLEHFQQCQRVMRAMITAAPTARVTAGRTRCLSLSSQPAWSGDCIPETGRMPGQIEQTICKMIPSQKTGMEKPIRTAIIEERSISEYWRVAEMIPTGTPNRTARNALQKVKYRVAWKRWSTRGRTSVELDGASPIALQHVAQPAEILDKKGLVQAKVMAQLGQRGGVGLGSKDDQRGVARRQVQNQEYQEGNSEQHGDEGQDASKNVTGHARIDFLAMIEKPPACGSPASNGFHKNDRQPAQPGMSLRTRRNIGGKVRRLAMTHVGSVKAVASHQQAARRRKPRDERSRLRTWCASHSNP